MSAQFVIFRGRRACVCLAEWLPVYEAELKRLAVIQNKIDIAQLTGGAPQSGGTHTQGGAFDLWQHSRKAIEIARQMGADADWARTKAQGFAPHQHGVLRGCPHNAPARYQITSTAYGVDHGKNGLANGGRDDGPRPLSKRTWKQGIAWVKARQKKAEPKPKTTHRDFVAAILNARSKTSGFPIRVPVINTRIRKYRPHFIGFTELQPGTRKRGLVSVALRSRWKLTFHAHNKAQYVLTSKNGWHKVATAKYSLGNSRHAIAVHYLHKGSGAQLVNVTPHLSWEHQHGGRRAAEARTLVGFLKRDFAGLPWLIAGDTNDSHKKTKTRPVDSSGVVFKAAGLHDLSFDPTNVNKRSRSINTAHGNKTPIPASGIHIDRFWGTADLKGLKWVNDVHGGRRASDHWLVAMTIRLTHPIKK